MASGLNSQCQCSMSSTLVAVASAPASMARATHRLMRPCMAAPSAHWQASSTPNHSALRAVEDWSACHRNSDTPAISATNCRPANQRRLRCMSGA